MDKNISWFYEKRAQSVIEALKANRMNGYYAPSAAEAAKLALSMIPAGSSVGLGGSMTLFEAGLVEALRQGDYALVDRYEKGISPAETMARLKQGLSADVFLSGVNAITEDGELYFVDATCNRVAATLFGPDKVILVAGCNKIVPDLEAAQSRIVHFVAPANAHRLGRKTPCAETGQCQDCSSPDRICNASVAIHKQANKDRLHVILVGEDMGL